MPSQPPGGIAVVTGGGLAVVGLEVVGPEVVGPEVVGFEVVGLKVVGVGVVVGRHRHPIIHPLPSLIAS